MQESCGIDFLFTEIFRQQITRGIVAQSCYGINPRAEIRQIVDRISASSGQRVHFPATQNEHGRFAGDPGNFTEDEFIGDEIA